MAGTEVDERVGGRAAVAGETTGAGPAMLGPVLALIVLLVLVVLLFYGLPRIFGISSFNMVIRN